MEQEVGHLPVMLEEVMLALSPHPGSFQIDATVGGGGHAVRILEAATPGGRLLGIDADARAIERSERRLSRFGDRVVLRQ
jgi:16S rRNA (cytosine1402-N4)-methyltransferase